MAIIDVRQGTPEPDPFVHAFDLHLAVREAVASGTRSWPT